MSDNCRCKWVSREGLYIMVFIILINTCSMKVDLNKHLKEHHPTKPLISNTVIDNFNRIDNNVQDWLRVEDN
jgi:hypothetical protein